MSKLKNKVLFCLDSSGSMQSLRRNAIDAFNNVLGAIREGAKAAGQPTTVGFYTFGGNIERRFFDAPVESARELTLSDYQPDGGTPLFECVHRAIQEALALNPDEDTSFVVNVITDGQENTSRITPAALKDLMSRVQKTDRWTITFLVPRGEKRSLVQGFGIPEGNVEEWDQTSAGTAKAATQVQSGYAEFFAARAAGKKSVKGFFTTDLSKLTAKEVKKNLTDLSDQLRVLKITKESAIKDFVEDKGLTYLKGRAFYQLTKDEKVQSNKEIMLQEKGKAPIYGGQEARQLLGLPEYDDVKVRPGNHANWDIYVQSTSTNRKLVRGTNLLYLK